MNNDGWIKVDDQKPPMCEVVMTKIDDEAGCRNEQTLKLVSGRLWFFPDGSMYVYYTPTHWRPAPQAVPCAGD